MVLALLKKMSRAVFLDLAYRDGRGFGCPLPDNGGAKGLGSGDGFGLPVGWKGFGTCELFILKIIKAWG